MKCPLFLSDFNETNFVDRLFFKNAPISNFMTIRQVGAELFRADGTGMMKLQVTFRNVAYAPKYGSIIHRTDSFDNLTEFRVTMLSSRNKLFGWQIPVIIKLVRPTPFTFKIRYMGKQRTFSVSSSCLLPSDYHPCRWTRNTGFTLL